METLEVPAMKEGGMRTTLPDFFHVKGSSIDEVMIQQLEAERKVLEESKKISRMIVCDLPD